MSNDIKTLLELEKEHILYAMDMFGRNKPKVAEALGVSLKTLYNKLNSYGLESLITKTTFAALTTGKIQHNMERSK